MPPPFPKRESVAVSGAAEIAGRLAATAASAPADALGLARHRALSAAAARRVDEGTGSGGCEPASGEAGMGIGMGWDKTACGLPPEA